MTKKWSSSNRLYGGGEVVDTVTFGYPSGYPRRLLVHGSVTNWLDFVITKSRLFPLIGSGLHVLGSVERKMRWQERDEGEESPQRESRHPG